MTSVYEDQKFAVKVLAAHIRRGRLAHAYLFTGGGEAEKAALAREFARSLNCAQDGVFEPCECVSCAKTCQGNHPDVRWLGTDPDVRTITIEEIRGLIQWASLKPYEGRRKVAILIDAGRLGPEASNAFLKTLEEPPADTVFCLLAGNRAHLLETIQSRSFEIRLAPAAETGEPEAAAQGLPWSEPTWEDFLETFSAVPREELRRRLGDLMTAVRASMKAGLEAGDREAANGHLEALDRIYEVQEALTANVNQKLALTRLAISLRRHLPYGGFRR